MKLLKISATAVLTALAFSILFYSCKKEKGSLDNETNNSTLSNKISLIKAGELHNGAMTEMISKLQLGKDLSSAQKSELAYNTIINYVAEKTTIEKSIILNFLDKGTFTKAAFMANSKPSFQIMGVSKSVKVLSTDDPSDINTYYQKVVNALDNAGNAEEFDLKMNEIEAAAKPYVGENLIVLQNVISIARASTVYWTDGQVTQNSKLTIQSLDSNKKLSKMTPNQKAVIKADVNGAIGGAISGATGGLSFAGVGAVPGAILGASLGATYGSAAEAFWQAIGF